MAFSAPATVRGRHQRQRSIHRNLDTLPTDATQRIIDTYNKATLAEKGAGLSWYYVAHCEAEELASQFGLTVEQTAGIIAALSPQTSWVENLSRAFTFCETGTTTHFENAVGKATAIRNGANPLDVLGGRKVRSFYRNILEPERSGAVTVDRHAVSILYGRPMGDAGADLLSRIGVYTEAAGFYRAAARRLGVLPSQVQAVTWVVWRRDHAWERLTTEAF